MNGLKIFNWINLTIKFIFLLLILGVISGCSSSAVPYTYVIKNHDRLTIKKVAVLSFYNNTKSAEASGIVTDAFIANLVGMKKFKVEFPGNIKSFLISKRIILKTGVDLDTVKLMGKQLGVEAFILGKVEDFVGINEKKKDVVPVVSVSARMLNAQTGKILWMAQHERTGNDYVKILDFGKVRSVGELTRKVVLEMIETMP